MFREQQRRETALAGFLVEFPYWLQDQYYQGVDECLTAFGGKTMATESAPQVSFQSPYHNPPVAMSPPKSLHPLHFQPRSL